jgi:hypothetical protein
MNAVEFLFALFAVFGSTGLWFAWIRFVYRLDKFTQDKQKEYEKQEETIIN